MFNVNAFQRFGMDATFDIDLQDLDRRYFSLQASVHPDHFATNAILDKKAAETVSADLNQAYEILKNPVRRTKCLLEIAGISLPDANPEILAEALEWQEKRAEAETPQDLGRLDTEIQASLQTCYNTLSQDFKAKKVPALQQGYLRLVYLSKLADDLKQSSGQGF